jgi:hypothetical protein
VWFDEALKFPTTTADVLVSDRRRQYIVISVAGTPAGTWDKRSA